MRLPASNAVVGRQLQESKYNVFLRFVAPDLDTLQWRGYRDAIINRLTLAFTGPFNHVCMFYRSPETGAWFCITVVCETRYVLHEAVKHSPRLDSAAKSYLRLACSREQLVKLRKQVMVLCERRAQFSLFYMMFCPKQCMPRTDVLTRYWFCSQLVAFLLMSSGILQPGECQNLRCELLSATELFLVVRGCQAAVPPEYRLVRSAQLPDYAENAKSLTADEAYMKAMRISVQRNIPTLDRNNCSAFA